MKRASQNIAKHTAPGAPTQRQLRVGEEIRHVLAGIFIRNEFRDPDLAIDGVYPPSAFPPVQFCHPDRLEEAIRELISDVPYRLALGKRACEFVRAEASG